MEKDPQVVARLAKERDEENWQFCSFLKWYSRISDARLNTIAKQAGRKAAGQIECLDCGACCRDIIVPLEDNEIAAMAKATGLTQEQFRERYVRSVENYEQAIDANPCPFQQGNHCTVYESRPSVCRGYPYVGDNVRPHNTAIVERADTCPIIFEMIEQLKTRLGFRQLRPG